MSISQITLVIPRSDAQAAQYLAGADPEVLPTALAFAPRWADGRIKPRAFARGPLRRSVSGLGGGRATYLSQTFA